MTTYYKALKKDGTCRGFKFEEGETYELEGLPILCEHGFHFCKDLVLTLQYYPVKNCVTENLYAEVEVLGDVQFEQPHQHKGCTNRLRIIRFLTDTEVVDLVDGNYNSGNRNSGNYNSGDWNSGDWNSTDRSSGYLNTQQEDTIQVFNKPCPRSVWESADVPEFFHFKLSDDYKQSWQESYAQAGKADRAKVKALPNFDADVFFELTGIDLR